mmetsp:Transcript_64883/g.146343  ORF Transcript_64883/g.146343 Transcript_64883/m.146343 type:complete len:322 (-) Transcript_64883:467-1432(-)
MERCQLGAGLSLGRLERLSCALRHRIKLGSVGTPQRLALRLGLLSEPRLEHLQGRGMGPGHLGEFSGAGLPVPQSEVLSRRARLLGPLLDLDQRSLKLAHLQGQVGAQLAPQLLQSRRVGFLLRRLFSCGVTPLHFEGGVSVCLQRLEPRLTFALGPHRGVLRVSPRLLRPRKVRLQIRFRGRGGAVLAPPRLGLILGKRVGRLACLELVAQGLHRCPGLVECAAPALPFEGELPPHRLAPPHLRTERRLTLEAGVLEGRGSRGLEGRQVGAQALLGFLGRALVPLKERSRLGSRRLRGSPGCVQRRLAPRLRFPECGCVH